MKNMISVIERDIKSKSVLVVGDFFLDKYILKLSIDVV